MKTSISLFALSLLFFAGCNDEANITDGGPLDEFAACLTDSGATFYGTEWCPHCKNQKAMFGNSMSQIDYVDCDISGMLCRKEGITGYPTWKFEDGSAASGTQPLSALASKTGCQLPDSAAAEESA